MVAVAILVANICVVVSLSGIITHLGRIADYLEQIKNHKP